MPIQNNTDEEVEVVVTKPGDDSRPRPLSMDSLILTGGVVLLAAGLGLLAGGGLGLGTVGLVAGTVAVVVGGVVVGGMLAGGVLGWRAMRRSRVSSRSGQPLALGSAGTLVAQGIIGRLENPSTFEDCLVVFRTYGAQTPIASVQFNGTQAWISCMGKTEKTIDWNSGAPTLIQLKGTHSPADFELSVGAP